MGRAVDRTRAGSTGRGGLPAQPVWMLAPAAALESDGLLPEGTRAYASALRGAERVAFTLGAQGDHLALSLDVTCSNVDQASTLVVQLEQLTETLRTWIAREHPKPNPGDLSGVLTAGTFRREDRRVYRLVAHPEGVRSSDFRGRRTSNLNQRRRPLFRQSGGRYAGRPGSGRGALGCHGLGGHAGPADRRQRREHLLCSWPYPGCAGAAGWRVGDDSFGQFVIDRLAGAGVDTAHIARLTLPRRLPSRLIATTGRGHWCIGRARVRRHLPSCPN